MFIPVDKLPNVADMEGELLSALLLKNGEVIPKISSILSEQDFFVKSHQIIFRAILALHRKGIVPNLLSLIEELKATKQLDTVGLKLVIDIGELAFSTAYAESQAKKIKEKSLLRSVILTGKELVLQALDNSQSPEQILKSANLLFNDLKISADSSDATKFSGFFNKKFQNNVNEMKIYSARKTGFHNIDHLQIFSPGLYVLGGLPALGKTSFAWQLLHQLAINGETCIFCSYEMSEFELFSKSISRELFFRDPNTSISSAGIRRGDFSPVISDILSDFQKSELNLFVLELHEHDIDDLLFQLEKYCTNRPPVIVLDYLQIIPIKKSNVSPKQAIDEIVRKLKNFQRLTNTTFIVVSSFNRLNYAQRVSFESFKESGNIEYSADVVWGLQLYCTNKLLDGATSKNRDIIDQAKKANPRQIQLCCLKNRQGTNYDVFFNYFPAHDCFVPCDESDFKNEETSGNAPINYHDDK